MSYICARCKEPADEIDENMVGIRCQYCGHRILLKKRPENILKKVKAE